MTNNELKIELLRMAIDIARENMFARRTTQENRFEQRVGEDVFPELSGLSIDEVINNYRTFVNTIV